MGIFKELKKLKETGNEMAEKSGRPTSMMGMLKQLPDDLANANAMLEQVQQGQEQSAHLQAVGVPARATIKNVGQTGTLINEAPVAILDLEVKRDGQDPYPVQLQTPVPQVYLARLVIGGEVGVKVDPSNAQSVMVDWSQP